ncbi:MAG: hypothetical protein ACYC0X_01445 [Pirellulaceae bacterium]
MKKLCPLLLVAAFTLLLTSCFDSKVPLSEPQNSKPDDRLTGVWRFQGEGGELNYYHFGRIAENLPASLMRVVNAQHTPDGKIQSAELLVFPTTIGDKSYLNVAELKSSQLQPLEEKGWTDDAFNEYLILRYQIKGDVLMLQLIDQEAKKRAVEGKKIKGTIERDTDGNMRAHFTDTTENLAKFVAEAGDDIFSKNVLRLEKVK